jgi:hypothetical protein
MPINPLIIYFWHIYDNIEIRASGLASLSSQPIEISVYASNFVVQETGERSVARLGIIIFVGEFHPNISNNKELPLV